VIGLGECGGGGAQLEKSVNDMVEIEKVNSAIAVEITLSVGGVKTKQLNSEINKISITITIKICA